MNTHDCTGTPAADSPITKIGTEVFGLRVISGYLHASEPGQILLRQLYPGEPADIGRIEMIGTGTGRLTVDSDRTAEWNDHERTALAAFFLTRYADRIISRPSPIRADTPSRGRDIDDRAE
ncbi:hypothetical protein [Glycomyces sp. YM15]|uniref:hypothetical protein n=1 Tax=Glycomyces sp. YM15 TaxID=2800446 RepID=UPI001966179C|nr:hypothetical protein [Glycomyces sp. YM15]